MHKYILRIKYWIANPKFKWITGYGILVTMVILLAFITRFYSFPDRWGIGADNGRDALIALEAISRHQLPLMGPFSSAGAFVTGGIYYWIVMLSYVLLPFLISAPWLMTGLVSVLNVALLIYLGKILVGKKFSIILGILGVLSPEYIGTAITLGNPGFVTIFAILNLIFFVHLISRKRVKYAFLSGLSIGLAISMHYQALNLLIFPFIVLFITKLTVKERIKSLVLAIAGILIASTPLLIWDSHQGFANLRNILDYFLIGQYRIYVPNSWRLFLFSYLPTYWGSFIGNTQIMGLILFISSMAMFVVSVFRKRVSPTLLILGIIFIILLIVNKFYKGERMDTYMYYLAPLILVFTAYLIHELSEFKLKAIKAVAVILLISIACMSGSCIKNAFAFKNNMQLYEMIFQKLVQRYPNTKFSLYDSKHENYMKSMPLSLLLRYKNVIDPKGKKIGVECKAKNCPPKRLIILSQPIKIVDMQMVPSSNLNPARGIWANVDPQFVYDNQVGWLNKYQLKSTFSLKNYIMGKVRIL